MRSTGWRIWRSVPGPISTSNSSGHRPAKAVDFVLYCERDSTGRRRVRELITVNGYSHAEQCFETEEIYRASSAAAA